MNKQYILKAIKVGSASIGLLCTVLIFYLAYTLAFRDNFYPQSDRIYQLMDRYESVDYSGVTNIVVQPIAPAMVSDFPEVESATVVRRWSGSFLIGENHIKTSYLFCDSLFFDVLPRPVLLGNQSDFFTSPYTAVVTESFAKDLWGTVDVLGKTIVGENQQDFEVKGVIADWPKNSSRSERLLLSFGALHTVCFFAAEWTNGDSFKAYLRLAEGVDPSVFTYNRFLEFQRKYFDVDAYIEKGIKSNYFLAPLDEVIFIDEDSSGMIAYVYIGLGLFFLALVLFNLFLLSQAQYKGYGIELNVHRINGASVLQLYKLLFVRITKEVFVVLGFMFLGFVVFAPWSKSYFSLDLFNLSISEYQVIFVITLGVLLLLFFASGVLPSVAAVRRTLSQNQSIHTKGIKTDLSFHIPLLLQLGISLVFLVSVLFMQRQVDYLRTLDMGYDSNNLVTISLNTDELLKKSAAMKQELSKISGIESLCFANATLTNRLSGGHFSKSSEGSDLRVCRFIKMDGNFTKTLRMQQKGTGFQTSINKGEIMLNERAVKAFDLKEPIGSVIYNNGTPLTVVGVFNNFITGPWYGLEPCVAYGVSEESMPNGHLILRLNDKSQSIAVAEIEEVFTTLCPDEVFDLRYYSDLLVYPEEEKLRTLFVFFTIIALLITWVGLVGQSLVRVHERLKEIGVRRVNGASVFSILGLLNRIEVIRIAIASILFLPIAWLALEKGGYASYAYHATLGIYDFVMIFCVLVFSVLTIVTVSVWKGVNTNPSKLLRSE